VLYLIVISLWGNNGITWEYIGNQYVYQIPMTKVQCENIVHENAWFKWEANEFYKVSMECVAAPDVAKGA
jgi:hypothetical protein